MVKASKIITITLVLVLSALSGVATAETVLHTERSIYRNIVVSDNFGTRCLRFSRLNNAQQSCFSLENPQQILFESNKMLLGALYLRPNPRKILMIGLGGGVLASAISRVVPEAEIDVVELDPAIVRVAKEYFHFETSARMRVTVSDGRLFVKRALERGEKYDLVLLDAFGEERIPCHLMTTQFLAELKGVVTADGVVAAHTFRIEESYDSESTTYEAVYGTFFNLSRFWNNSRVILATKDGSLPSQAELTRNAKALEKKFQPLGVKSSWLLPLFSTDKDWDDSARLLTDQYVPF